MHRIVSWRNQVGLRGMDIVWPDAEERSSVDVERKGEWRTEDDQGVESSVCRMRCED